jgi:hypothetical protein
MEAAPFWLVAQCLNQVYYRVPHMLAWQSVNHKEVDEEEAVLKVL